MRVVRSREPGPRKPEQRAAGTRRPAARPPGCASWVDGTVAESRSCWHWEAPRSRRKTPRRQRKSSTSSRFGEGAELGFFDVEIGVHVLHVIVIFEIFHQAHH